MVQHKRKENCFIKLDLQKNKYNDGDLTREEYYEKLSSDLKVSIKEIKEMDMRMSGKEFSLDEELRDGEKQTRVEFLSLVKNLKRIYLFQTSKMKV